MVKEGVDFVSMTPRQRRHHPLGADQIIFDEENRGGAQNLLPNPVPAPADRFYGDSMQAFVPSYLGDSLNGFTQQQERLRGQVAGAMGVAPGMVFLRSRCVKPGPVDRAMKMFTPSLRPARDTVAPAPPPSRAKPADTSLES